MASNKWSDTAFGKRIKSQRENRKLSQAQMARILSNRGVPIHATAIAKIESGDRSVRINEAAAFADLFETTVDALLGRIGPDRSSLEFALVVLSDYASDAARQIAQSERVVSDIEDQLESVEENFQLPTINQLHRAASEMANHLAAARKSSSNLSSALETAILKHTPGTKKNPKASSSREGSTQ